MVSLNKNIIIYPHLPFNLNDGAQIKYFYISICCKFIFVGIMMYKKQLVIRSLQRCVKLKIIIK